jgi:hypothetical protein
MLLHIQNNKLYNSFYFQPIASSQNAISGHTDMTETLRALYCTQQ